MPVYYFPEDQSQREVPDDKVSVAESLGGTPMLGTDTVGMYFPDGSQREVPLARIGDAKSLGAGFRGAQAPAPLSSFKQQYPNWIGPEPTSASSLFLSEKGRAYTGLQRKMLEGKSGFISNIVPDETNIPFAGSALEALDIGKLVTTARRFSNGERVGDEELLDLNLYMLDRQRKEQSTLGGKVANIVKGSVTFGAEFIALSLTTGVGGIGWGIGRLTGKGVEKGGVHAISQYVREAVKKKAMQALTRGATQAAAEAAEKAGAKSIAAKVAGGLAYAATGGALQSGVAQGVQLAATGGQTKQANTRQLQQILTNEEDKESYLTSLGMGALGDWIERSSEYMGGDLAKAGSAALTSTAAGTAIRDAFKKALSETGTFTAAQIDKAALKSGAVKLMVDAMDKFGLDAPGALTWLKRAGYDGVLSEMGEERVGGFLQGLTGTDGSEGGLAAAWDGMLPDTGTDAAAELIAFALPMSYVGAVNKFAQSKLLGGAGMDTVGRVVKGVRDIGSGTKEAEDTDENRAKVASVAEDLVTTSKEKDAPLAVSLAARLLTFPFTFNLNTARYGSAEEALVANELPNFLAQAKSIRTYAALAGLDETATDAHVKRWAINQLSATSGVSRIKQETQDKLRPLGYEMGPAQKSKSPIFRDRYVYPRTLRRIAGTEAKAIPADLMLELIQNNVMLPQTDQAGLADMQSIFSWDAKTLREALQPGANPEATANLMNLMGIDDSAANMDGLFKSGKQVTALLDHLDNTVLPGSTTLVRDTEDPNRQEVYDVVDVVGDVAQVRLRGSTTDTAVPLTEVGEGKPFRKLNNNSYLLTTINSVVDTWENLMRGTRGAQNGFDPAVEPDPSTDEGKRILSFIPDTGQTTPDGKKLYQLGSGAGWKRQGYRTLTALNISHRNMLYSAMEEAIESRDIPDTLVDGSVGPATLARRAKLQPRYEALYNMIQQAPNIKEADKASLAKLKADTKKPEAFQEHMHELYNKAVLQIGARHVEYKDEVRLPNGTKVLVPGLAFSAEYFQHLPQTLVGIFGAEQAKAIESEYDAVFGKGWQKRFEYQGWLTPVSRVDEAAEPVQATAGSMPVGTVPVRPIRPTSETPAQTLNRVATFLAKGEEAAGMKNLDAEDQKFIIDNQAAVDKRVAELSTAVTPEVKTPAPSVELKEGEQLVTSRQTKSSDRSEIAAWRNPDGTYGINPDQVLKKFDNKAWTKPRVAGVLPLPGDSFKTLDDWVKFIAAHESLHASVRPTTKQSEAEYENRINQQALNILKLPETKWLNESKTVLALYRKEMQRANGEQTRPTAVRPSVPSKEDTKASLAVGQELPVGKAKAPAADPQAPVQVKVDLTGIVGVTPVPAEKTKDLIAKLNAKWKAPKPPQVGGESLVRAIAPSDLVAIHNAITADRLPSSATDSVQALEAARFERMVRIFNTLAVHGYPQTEGESDEAYVDRVANIVGSWVSEHSQIAVPEGVTDAPEFIQQAMQRRIEERAQLSDESEDGVLDEQGSPAEEVVNEVANSEFDISSELSQEEQDGNSNNDDLKLEKVINEPDVRLFRFVMSRVLGIGVADTLGVVSYMFNQAHRTPGAALRNEALSGVPLPTFDQDASEHYTFSPEAYQRYLTQPKQTVQEQAFAAALSLFTYDEFMAMAPKLGLQNFEYVVFEYKKDNRLSSVDPDTGAESKVFRWFTSIRNRDNQASAATSHLRKAFAQSTATPAARDQFLREFASTFMQTNDLEKGLPKVTRVQGGKVVTPGVSYAAAVAFLSKWFGFDAIQLGNLQGRRPMLFPMPVGGSNNFPTDKVNAVEQAVDALRYVLRSSKVARSPGAPASALNGWREDIIKQVFTGRLAGTDPRSANVTPLIKQIAGNVMGVQGLSTRGQQPRTLSSKTTIMYDTPLTAKAAAKGWKTFLMGGLTSTWDDSFVSRLNDVEMPPYIIYDEVLRDIHDNPRNHLSLLRLPSDKADTSLANRMVVPFPRSEKKKQFGLVLDLPNKEPTPPEASPAERRAVYQRNLAKAVELMHSEILGGVEDFKDIANAYKRFGVYNTSGLKLLNRQGGLPPRINVLIVDTGKFSDGAMWLMDHRVPQLKKSLGMSADAVKFYIKGHFVDSNLLLKPLTQFLDPKGLAAPPTKGEAKSKERELYEAVSAWNLKHPDQLVDAVVDAGSAKRKQGARPLSMTTLLQGPESLEGHLLSMDTGAFRETTNLDTDIRTGEVPMPSQSRAFRVVASVVNNLSSQSVKLFNRFLRDRTAAEAVKPPDSVTRLWLESGVVPDNFPGLGALYMQNQAAALRKLTNPRGAGVSYIELPSREVSYAPVEGARPLGIVADYTLSGGRIRAARVMLNATGSSVRYSIFVPRILGDMELGDKEALVNAISRRTIPASGLSGSLHDAIVKAQADLESEHGHLKGGLFYARNRMQDLLGPDGRVLEHELEDVVGDNGEVLGWYIPGAFTNVIRIPRSGHESQTHARLSRPIPGGAPAIITHPEVKRRAGADDDADTRKVLFFSVDQDGNITTSTDKEYEDFLRDSASDNPSAHRAAFLRFKRAAANDMLLSWKRFFEVGHTEAGQTPEQFLGSTLLAEIQKDIFDTVEVPLTAFTAGRLGLPSGSTLPLGKLIKSAVFQKNEMASVEAMSAMEQLVGSSVGARGSAARLLSLYNLVLRQGGARLLSPSQTTGVPTEPLRDELGNPIAVVEPEAFATGAKDQFLSRVLSAYVNIIIDDVNEQRAAHILGSSEGINLAVGYAIASPHTDPVAYAKDIVALQNHPAIRFYLRYARVMRSGRAGRALRMTDAETAAFKQAGGMVSRTPTGQEVATGVSENDAWAYARSKSSDKAVSEARPFVTYLRGLSMELFAIGRALDAYYAKAPTTVNEFFKAEKDVLDLESGVPSKGESKSDSYKYLASSSKLSGEMVAASKEVLSALRTGVFSESPLTSVVAETLFKESALPLKRQVEEAKRRKVAAPRDSLYEPAALKSRNAVIAKLFMTEAVFHAGKVPSSVFYFPAKVSELAKKLYDNLVKSEDAALREGKDPNLWAAHLGTKLEDHKEIKPPVYRGDRASIRAYQVRLGRGKLLQLTSLLNNSELSQANLKAVHAAFDSAVDAMMGGNPTVDIDLGAQNGVVKLDRDNVKWFLVAYQSARYGDRRSSGALMPMLPTSLIAEWGAVMDRYRKEVWDRSDVLPKDVLTRWAKYHVKGWSLPGMENQVYTTQPDAETASQFVTEEQPPSEKSTSTSTETGPTGSDRVAAFNKRYAKTPKAEGESLVRSLVASAALATSALAQAPAELIAKYEGSNPARYKDVERSGKWEWAVGPGYRLFPERKAEFEAATGASFDKVRTGIAKLSPAQLAKLNDLVGRKSLSSVLRTAPVLKTASPATQAHAAQLDHASVFPVTFPAATAALKRGDWNKVAAELRDSDLYRNKDGKLGGWVKRLEDAARQFEAEAGKGRPTPAPRARPAVSGESLVRPTLRDERLATTEAAWNGIKNHVVAALTVKHGSLANDSYDKNEGRASALLDRLSSDDKRERVAALNEVRGLLRDTVVFGYSATAARTAIDALRPLIESDVQQPTFDKTLFPDYATGESLVRVTNTMLGMPVAATELLSPTMHMQLKEAEMKRLALQIKLGQLLTRHAYAYGVTDNGNLYSVASDGAINAKKVLGTMTKADKVWVKDLFSIPAALVESNPDNPDVKTGRSAGVLYNDKLTREQKARILAKIITSKGERNPLVVHGNQFKDGTIDVPAAEAVADMYARWMSPDNETRKKLEAAGRLPSGQTWADVLAEAALEAHDYYDNAFSEVGGKYWRGYLTRVYGFGRKDAEQQAAEDRYLNALDKATPEGDKRALDPATLVEQRQDGPAVKATKSQVTMLQGLMAEHALEAKKRIDQKTLLAMVGRPRAIKDFTNLTAHEVNSALLFELEAIQRIKAFDTTYNADDVANRRDLNTIKRLRQAVNRSKYREWSGRAMAREYREAQTYADVFLQSEGRLKPDTMYVYELLSKYTNDVLGGILHKQLLNNYASMLDETGKPVLVAVSNPQADIGDTPLLEEVTRRAMLDNVVRAAGKKLTGEVKTADLDKVLREEIQKSLAKEGYVRMDSPYPSVSEFWVRKGVPHKVVQHLLQPELSLRMGDHDMLKGLMRVTMWSKITSVGWSLFFPLSLMESVIAGTGLKNNVLWSYKGKLDALALYRNGRDIYNIAKNARRVTEGVSSAGTDFDFAVFSHDLARFGGVDLGHRAATDAPITIIDKDRVQAREYVRRKMGDRAATTVDSMLRLWTKGPVVPHTGGANLSNYFFDFWFPAMKLWAAHRLADSISAQTLGKAYEDLAPSQQQAILTEVGPVINDAYGGQFWKRYLWANPRTMQILNLLMFAPNWTLSAWNVAGGGLLTGRVMGNYLSDKNVDFVFKTNWPAMYLVALIGIPTALQLAISGAAGGGDDDKLVASMNEYNRGGLFPYIDITPLVRKLPWYQGDPTGQRRMYARFGKQAYEVLQGWLTEPVDQFMRKLSQPAKAVWEMTTGKSPGSDYNLEFSGQGLMGWLVTEHEGEKSIATSRLGYLAQKVLPMSFLTLDKNPDTFIAAFIVPTSKGLSFGRGTDLMVQALQTYADDKAWDAVRSSDQAKRNLAMVVPEVVKALEANGYDSTKALDTARGVVLGRLYKRFADAMNDGDAKKMDVVARQILRVGGSTKGLEASLNQKRKISRLPLVNPEEQAQVEATLRKAGG